MVAWENDVDTKERGLKAVRGQDDLPIEVVTVGETFAFLVNGQKIPFAIGDLDLAVRDLCSIEVLKEGYQVEMVKRLSCGKRSKPFPLQYKGVGVVFAYRWVGARTL